MKNLRKSAIVLVAAALATIGGINVYAADTVVEVSSLASEVPEIVAFPENEKPMEINNTLYVPSRVMAEAMGMEATWNQDKQTAELTVSASQYSEKPIERYAYRISEGGADSAGIDAVPADVSIELGMNSSIALLKFGYIDGNGERVELGKTTELDGAATLTDGGTLMFPLRSVTESLGLDLSWDQQSRTADIAIPEIEVIPNELGYIADDTVVHTSDNTSETSESDNSNLVYLGTFRISHYAPGAQSNGTWGNATAWAGSVTPGVTIAVDKNVIKPLSWVYIDGYGYRRAEDCGGAIVGNKIDVAVATYEEAMNLGVVYKDVYLCVE